MLSQILVNLFFVLLEMAAALAAIAALLGGIVGLPIFPIRSHLGRAGAGILTWMAIGSCLGAWQHAVHRYGLGFSSIVFLFSAYVVIAAWAVWLWPEKVLGFFYSFFPHPAADIVDRYVATNEGFNVRGIKKAMNEVPDDPVLLKVRTRQAADLAEKLEQENELVTEHEKVERLLVELKKARARVEVFEKRRGNLE